ncbi:MAG: sulfur carrier protein ThiS [Gemmatimonadota bacterium]
MALHPTTAETIEVVANGRVRAVPAGSMVREFLIELNLDPDVVVVERNGEILSRDRFADVRLETGDTLEVVHIVGGG